MDLDTPLEKIFGLVFRIAAIAWGICLIVWITSGFDETFLSYAIQGTIAMVFFTFLDRSLSCSWEIDGAMERIYFCRSFLKWKKRWPRFAFEEVAAIVVDGRYWKLKHGTQWEYFILLVLKDGMVIPASDYERDDLDGLNATAQGYAKALGVPFLPGRQGYATEVYFDESGKQLHVEQVSLP